MAASTHKTTPDCENHHDHCSHAQSNPSVHQSLDELEFERGIWSSALSGDIDDVMAKIHRNRDLVDAVDKSGYTALHYACRSGHTEVCKFLVSQGADVNAATQSSQATPLHRAAYMGHHLVVALLLDNGADAAQTDCDGMMALHKASENNHLETVKLLVKACPTSADVRDRRGRTPQDLTKTDEVKELLQQCSKVS